MQAPNRGLYELELHYKLTSRLVPVGYDWG